MKYKTYEALRNLGRACYWYGESTGDYNMDYMYDSEHANEVGLAVEAIELIIDGRISTLDERKD